MRSRLALTVLAVVLAACGAGASRPSPTPPSGEPRACLVSDVDMAFRGWQGATGSLEGTIGMTNQSATRCVLSGYPKNVELLDAGGSPLPLTLDQWKTFAVPAPVILEPGTGGVPPRGEPLKPGQGSFGMNWMNWCLTRVVDVRAMRVTLPDGSLRMVPVQTDNGASPRCDGTAAPSVLSIGPFEAAPAR